VRRNVLNYSGRSLNRYFPAISKSIDRHNVVESLIQGLKNYGWPDDKEFVQGLRSAPLYNGFGVRNILSALEESYHHKEPAILDNVTVEHVMPQTLTPDWQKELGQITRRFIKHFFTHWAILLYRLTTRSCRISRFSKRRRPTLTATLNSINTLPKSTYGIKEP